jgi:hypothetical protein
MEKRVWTAREAVTAGDKAVIKRIAGHNPVASRIFLTGEVHEDYIGETASILLDSINDVIDGAMKGHDGKYIEEPLFIRTKQGTIQLSRFEPEAIWKTFNPDLLQRIQGEEEKRLGIEVQLDEFDFYQSLVSTFKTEHGAYIFPVVEKYSGLDVFYNIVYLSALLLYGKPGYMAVPVSQHFALPENAGFIREVKFRPLTKVEQKKVVELREKHKVAQGLTNPELSFLLNLYDADAGRQKG